MMRCEVLATTGSSSRTCVCFPNLRDEAWAFDSGAARLVPNPSRIFVANSGVTVAACWTSLRISG
jgi:hypothetical protein